MDDLPETKYPLTAEEEMLLNNLFSYHPPFGDQAIRYEQIRAAGGVLMRVLYENCPRSSELTLARRDIESAIMRANQSIAVNEGRM